MNQIAHKHCGVRRKSDEGEPILFRTRSAMKVTKPVAPDRWGGGGGGGGGGGIVLLDVAEVAVTCFKLWVVFECLGHLCQRTWQVECPR